MRKLTRHFVALRNALNRRLNATRRVRQLKLKFGEVVVVVGVAAATAAAEEDVAAAAAVVCVVAH